MENEDTGLLLVKKDIELHRKYFKEMVRLLGIQVIYRSPMKNKHWDKYGELDTYYNAPEIVGCIFDEHPNQWTMKKLGWNAEQNETKSIIHVPYDLNGLEAGALFIIPSGLDNSQGRLFRVTRMSTIQVYPASVACEIAPEYESTFEASQLNHPTDTFNLLADEEDKEETPNTLLNSEEGE